ncbi:hypothetical protein BDZ97DRAFT_1815012 [Flammula alnicola]|nr:hypothetical protein BDZ97DRAFT_1815012 [Flammula alnicola]
MVHVFDLDSDIYSLLFALLNASSLRALASSSRKWFQLTAPALVRTVKLSCSPHQVLEFCNFSLKYRLCPHIISLTLSASAVYSQPPKNYIKGYVRSIDIAETALFANALAEVLEGAVNLTHLAFEDCTAVLIENESHIADIICRRPPALSLELTGADASSMRKFSSVSGLAHLKLYTLWPPKYDEEAEDILDTILMNSIHTLESLSLRQTLPAILGSEHLSSSSWERVHYFSMSGFPVHSEHVARLFPNIRSMDITRTDWVTREFDGRTVSVPPIVQFDCPPKTLWTELRSFSGPKQLALNLSRHHSLRRISFLGLVSLYTNASEFAQLSDTLHNCDIRSLCLELELVGTPGAGVALPELGFCIPSIDDAPPLLDPLFSTLSQSANHLTYLSIHVGQNLNEIPYYQKHLVRTAPLLASLNNLKYVELGVTAWMTHQSFSPVEISMKPEELVRIWVDSVPSLQYLELSIICEGWKHSWWRIESLDSQPRMRRVSEEEGLSAKRWFDLEEWK